jgi:hypothetical protein
VLIVVEAPPTLTTGTVRDLASCSLGTVVEWGAATFRDPSASGVYNVYRSTTSCAHALTQPAIALGLTTLSWVDTTTVDGVPYYYVVQAEDARLATVCSPQGPNNGGAVNVTTLCLGPVLDVNTPAVPDLLGWGLRVSHVLHDVTLNWSRGRALLPTEHYHVLKGYDPRSIALASPEGLTAVTWLNNDRISTIQFFDVRIASPCENQSADDEPPGWDNGR